MTPGEVARLLGLAARLDHRKQSDAATEAWWELLEHYDYNDAVVALRVHRTTSTEWLMPAHLINTMDDWDRAWLDAGRTGPRPPGWPEAPTVTIAGPDLPAAARAAAMGQAPPRPAIEGP